MLIPEHGLVVLARWLQQVRYNDVRRAESFQPITLLNGKRLRGVMVAPDLCLSRSRTFFKIIDKDHAVVIPLTLVAEQYSLDAIKQGYADAKKTQKRKRAS
jgi:hypothetical protein